MRLLEQPTAALDLAGSCVENWTGELIAELQALVQTVCEKQLTETRQHRRSTLGLEDSNFLRQTQAADGPTVRSFRRQLAIVSRATVF
jgi:hypothetical protein